MLRFLLADTTASAPLSAAEVARLRRESLEPLDLRLRRAMDAAHLEAGEIERRDRAEIEIEQMQMQMQRGEMAPPEALAARRLDFTRLHVAVEVPRRVLEPCANYQLLI